MNGNSAGNQDIPSEMFEKQVQKLQMYKRQVKQMRENMNLFKENIELLKQQNNELQSKVVE